MDFNFENLVLFAILLMVVLVLEVNGTSWRDREKQRSFGVESVFNSVDGGSDSSAMGITEPCEDEILGCKKLKELCHVKVVRQKCKETCWTCRAPAPPVDCSKTRHGCCWDNITISRGQQQQGCPACQDKYAECSQFKHFCSRSDIRRICPVSCGINCTGKTCQDDQYQAVVCPMYKKYGFCKIDPQLMAKACSRTCGLCLYK